MDDIQRPRGTLRRFTSFEAMKADEYAYWQSRPAHERLAAVTELSIEGYRLKGALPANQDFEDLLAHLNAEGASRPSRS